MPNHVHGIIIIGPANGGAASSALRWGMSYGSSNPLRRSLLIVCLGRRGQPLWQRNYYEHIIREDKSLNRIREYIVSNPLSWHLDRENPEAQGKDDFDTWLTRL